MQTIPSPQHISTPHSSQRERELLTESQENLVFLLLQVELIHLKERLKLFAVDVVKDFLRERMQGRHIQCVV